MSKRMSYTFEEYVDAGGWSSHYFLEHAKHLIPDVKKMDNVELKIGRHVIHILLHGKVFLKAYVHYKGRSREFLTFTDKRGRDIITFHYTESWIHIGLWLMSTIGMELTSVSRSQGANKG